MSALHGTPRASSVTHDGVSDWSNHCVYLVTWLPFLFPSPAFGSAAHKPKGFTHQTYVWSSKDGRAWGEPAAVADPGYWLWRISWHDKTAYGKGYQLLEDVRAEPDDDADAALLSDLQATQERPLAVVPLPGGHPGVGAGDREMLTIELA